MEALYPFLSHSSAYNWYIQTGIAQISTEKSDMRPCLLPCLETLHFHFAKGDTCLLEMVLSGSRFEDNYWMVPSSRSNEHSTKLTPLRIYCWENIWWPSESHLVDIESYKMMFIFSHPRLTDLRTLEPDCPAIDDDTLKEIARNITNLRQIRIVNSNMSNQGVQELISPQTDLKN
jgi:hypothetical protein